MAQGRIRKESLEKLITHVNLPEYLGGFMDVRRSGQNFTARCPFHNEKTASFYIYDDHYHCFGCKAHGNAIDYEMHRTGASFPEAAESLAERTRFPLEYDTQFNTADKKEAEESSRLTYIMSEVSKRYEQYLQSNAKEAAQARAYLTKRGFTQEQIAQWQIGLSPQTQRLVELAKERGWDVADLKNLGLVREHDGGRIYDFFRGRIMFPIKNERGQVIAFGGRVYLDSFKEQGPKYINSPETKLFSKSSTLFNLNQARASIVREKSVVIVEGYMDAIALVNAGVENVVAVLGTALTQENVRKIARLTNTATLCFDSDAAGQNALTRSFEVAYPLNLLTLQTIQVPAGKDPDDFIRAHGVGAMRELLQSPSSLLEKIAKNIIRSIPQREAQLRVIKEKLVPTIVSNPDLAQREIALDTVRSLLGLSSIRGLEQNVQAKKFQPAREEPQEPSKPVSAQIQWQPESLDILKLLLSLAAATAGDVPARLKNTLDDVASEEAMDELICGKAVLDTELSQTTRDFFHIFNRLWNLDKTMAPAAWPQERFEDSIVQQIPQEYQVFLSLMTPRPVDAFHVLGMENWSTAWASAPPFRGNAARNQTPLNLFSVQNVPYLRFLCREITFSIESKALPTKISDLVLKLELAYLDKELLLANGSEERSRRILHERARRQMKFQG